VLQQNNDFEEDLFDEAGPALAPWVLVLYFDYNKVSQSTWNLIREKYKKLLERYSRECQISESPFNTDSLYWMIRLKQNAQIEGMSENWKSDYEQLVSLDTIIRQELLGGIPKVIKVYNKDEVFNYFDEQTGQIKKKREYYLETDGSNFKKILI